MKWRGNGLAEYGKAEYGFGYVSIPVALLICKILHIGSIVVAEMIDSCGKQ